mgnify:FL=1
MKTEKTKSKKALKIVIIIVAVICLFLLGIRAYFRLPVAEYYRNSEKSFLIPGISDGAVLQGLEYANGKFLVCGYMSDGSASKIYVVDGKNNSTEKKLLLQKQDGSAYTGHAGGVAVNGKYVYVADGSDKCLYVYLLADIDSASDGGSVKSIGCFSTRVSETDYLSPAFVTVADGKVFIGEFYREENYKTPDTHKIKTASGDENPAIIIAFESDESAPYGISQKISEVYSVRGLVQGMAVTEDRIYLSASYAVAFSHIYTYDKKSPADGGTLSVLGQTAKLYVLDTPVADTKIAPMSEEIVVVNGRLYVMCESATNKYIFGKLTGARYCYATDIKALEGGK